MVGKILFPNYVSQCTSQIGDSSGGDFEPTLKTQEQMAPQVKKSHPKKNSAYNNFGSKPGKGFPLLLNEAPKENLLEKKLYSLLYPLLDQYIQTVKTPPSKKTT